MPRTTYCVEAKARLEACRRTSLPKLNDNESMPLIPKLALLLVFACLAQLVSVVECERGAGRKGKREGGTRSQGGNKGVFKGRFSTKDKACIWEASGEDTYTLTVKCSQGEIQQGLNCNYTAKPAICPEYEKNVKGFWKQIARALKKQKKLCTDPRALVKAGMCRRAPQDAHFRLSPNNEVAVRNARPTRPAVKEEDRMTSYIKPAEPVSTSGPECTERPDHRKLAQEKCGEAWASFCTFFFTFVQSGPDC
ncbi:fibroblast growth factor-binding protein 1 [Chanos chanos]|uniref:Fibroblast growth factor-binding protein 1 n=1 Tax=Chanos chanos TaxID=29144 RepID=A0A6J2WDK1_CHACN|nr:fibroblast growth factor-binding protein 1-like [Chanos chanos]